MKIFTLILIIIFNFVFSNCILRFNKLTFNYNPEIVITNVTLDNSNKSMSLIGFHEIRLKEATKMIMILSVFVPESESDKIYNQTRIRTSINLCQDYDKNSFKQKILFNFNSTATTSEDGCPAKIGNFTRENIIIPDIHLPYIPLDMKFRVNITQKDMIKGSKKFVFSHSFELYGILKNLKN
ncbi:hypothetical protein PVAND_016046 [Polypedilum vanderplanki]|uniref:Uncharacterized protein n=1 Tax=Polypedilum vanderplanki TaxID=319348 RepID=A0A9J6BF21_POLVA|nr:hypothetical protein PVAND_016046 [Polypedilum vanderplanki]